MTDKKGKRAVIINNIRSKSIEQAIFILKSPEKEGYIDPGGYIISEAQEIINSYIKRMEGTSTDKTRRFSSRKFVAAIVALLTIVTASVAFAVFKS